jgi:hypothetical protein
MHFSWNKNTFIFLAAIVFLFFSETVSASTASFFVDPNYDLYGREDVQSFLMEETERGSFYVEQNWWNELNETDQEKNKDYLKILAYEFEENILPILSDVYRWDWIAQGANRKIHILIHPMRGSAGGYFRSIDQWDRLQNPYSNQKQVVYLNSAHLDSYYIRSLLSHELMHLITFHKKEKVYQVSEDVWLNEARAEYAPTLVGYDRVYEESNLQKRARIFLEYPGNSLVSWEEKIADYGALNLFIQYLVDHYGHEILSDSLESQRTGIASLNEALIQNGYQENFATIYTNWTIAVLVNDCSLGEYYCYQNSNLKNLHIIPRTNFLPLSGESSLSATDRLQNWGAQWIRFIGGDGDLRLKLYGQSETLFQVPYVLMDRQGKTEVGRLNLNEYQNGEIFIPNFGAKYYSLTIIPSVQSKYSGFNGSESYYPFRWEVTMFPQAEGQKRINELQNQIDALYRQITYLRSQIALALSRQQGIALGSFDQDLFLGTSGESVKALQLFLAIQEPQVYPEGLVTGNFYELTHQAIIRFQEKYAEEILTPIGRSLGTGYVGARTRDKLNELLFIEP